MSTIARHTSGDIARILDRDVAQVRHVLNTRRHIRPHGRVGIARVYDDQAVALVRAELESIDARTSQEPIAA